MKPMKHSLMKTNDKSTMQLECRLTTSKTTVNKAVGLALILLALRLAELKQLQT